MPLRVHAALWTLTGRFGVVNLIDFLSERTRTLDCGSIGLYIGVGLFRLCGLGGW